MIELGETYVLQTPQDHLRRGAHVVAEDFDPELGIRVRSKTSPARRAYVHVLDLRSPA